MFLVRALTKKRDSESSLEEEADDVSVEYTTTPILKCDHSITPPPGYPRNDLGESQIAMIEELRAYINEYIIEDTPENQTQREKELKWLDEPCLVRYLRATKFDLEDSSSF